MSKIKYILLWVLIILINVGCDNDEGESYPSDISLSRSSVTFSTETDGVSVLIFGKKDNNYKYLKSISSGWSADGKVSTILELGYYKFLFFKSAGHNTTLLPVGLNGETTFDEIKILSKPDAHGVNYVQPVDEIWLPETASLAENEYHIDGAKTISNKLTRAVSQVVLKINRGYSDNTGFKPLVFEQGKSIMDNIASIEMDISGVGDTINIYKSGGSKKTYHSATEATTITTEGFASFTGPFVFPAVTGQEAEVKITINPINGSAFPKMEKIVNQKLERNKKLEITLWMTSTYEFIDISIDLSDITEEIEGDTGIWE